MELGRGTAVQPVLDAGNALKHSSRTLQEPQFSRGLSVSSNKGILVLLCHGPL